MADFERLASALYDGSVKASDIKAMPGTDSTASRDRLAKSLFESMQRVGLIVDGKLINNIEPKS